MARPIPALVALLCAACGPEVRDIALADLEAPKLRVAADSSAASLFEDNRVYVELSHAGEDRCVRVKDLVLTVNGAPVAIDPGGTTIGGSPGKVPVPELVCADVFESDVFVLPTDVDAKIALSDGGTTWEFVLPSAATQWSDAMKAANGGALPAFAPNADWTVALPKSEWKVREVILTTDGACVDPADASRQVPFLGQRTGFDPEKSLTIRADGEGCTATTAALEVTFTPRRATCPADVPCTNERSLTLSVAVPLATG